MRTTVDSISGVAIAAHSTLTANPTNVVADGTSTSTITMQAKDVNDNNLTTGGLTVTMSVNGSATLSSVSGNADGTYTATITNSTVETVTVSAAFVGDADAGDSKVGNTVNISFTFASKAIHFDNQDYITLKSPRTGRIWLDRSLGAKRVATSRSDTQSYGRKYNFGEAICPVNFKVPTWGELNAELVKWTQFYSGFLKIPSPDQGSKQQKYLWTSTTAKESGNAIALSAKFGRSFAYSTSKFWSLSVRCIRK
ncbi:invasin domain 3-containing protein [bacterium endosymbiont of Bathymodiolus sp. 5 South]|uniref:invasin domain 3-containing protein n=1 Tax=bacterium endosymbiont of Bathymodiolus sp. 5 South TaxID=1181670 RepID=UPI0010BC64C4|nr:invasin domain 3-containing protein [bacterium endosymbiont of Bathymodiolus sp. 5 South]SSC08835.1 putative invasin [bacterium endosymbiont of Bathymodiolus sp. 5 South]